MYLWSRFKQLILINELLWEISTEHAECTNVGTESMLPILATRHLETENTTDHAPAIDMKLTNHVALTIKWNQIWLLRYFITRSFTEKKRVYLLGLSVIQEALRTDDQKVRGNLTLFQLSGSSYWEVSKFEHIRELGMRIP